jgi:HEAT repeat protein
VSAARSLRRAEAVPALVAIARGAPERELRRRAATALGDLGGVTTEDLVALIDDPVTRGSALGAVARLDHREALPAVRERLRSDDPGDRAAALAALAALEGPSPARPASPGRSVDGESVAALERLLLTDVDGEARVAAAMALARRRGAGALRVIEAATTVAWSAAMLDGLSLAATLARDPTRAAEP